MNSVSDDYKCGNCGGGMVHEEKIGNGSSAVKVEKYRCNDCGVIGTRRKDKRSDVENLIRMVRV